MKAVAYQSGSEIGTIAFNTAGKAQKLVLTPDRPKLKASRDDLSYVMVKVVDDKGHPRAGRSCSGFIYAERRG